MGLESGGEWKREVGIRQRARRGMREGRLGGLNEIGEVPCLKEVASPHMERRELEAGRLTPNPLLRSTPSR